MAGPLSAEERPECGPTPMIRVTSDFLPTTLFSSVYHVPPDFTRLFLYPVPPLLLYGGQLQKSDENRNLWIDRSLSDAYCSHNQPAEGVACALTSNAPLPRGVSCVWCRQIILASSFLVLGTCRIAWTVCCER